MPVIHDAPDAVVVDSVEFGYGKQPILRGVSATCTAGTLTAIVGPSGCGKTTLLSIIGGWIAADSGSVRLRTGGRWTAPDRGTVAWVPQGRNCLPHRSVLDNVLIGPLAHGIAEAEALTISEDALQLVGLHDTRRVARTLSGGELQRVAIARAVAACRPIVLADEPTSSLDEDNARQVASSLKRIAATSLVITATHDPLVTAVADVLIELRSHQ